MDYALSELTKEQISDLKQHFQFAAASETVQLKEFISCRDLLDEVKCAAFLDALSRIIDSPSRMVTASQLAKRYAFIAMVPVLYSMSLYNRRIDLSPEYCSLHWEADGVKWKAGIHVSSQITAAMPNDREQWRNEAVKTIFKHHVTPLWRVLSATANVPMSILWENAAVRIFSLYEKRLTEEGGLKHREQVQEDFQFLLSEQAAPLFDEKENPLVKFYSPLCASANSSSSVRVRKTCCFYYEVADKKVYCSNCPKVK